MLGSQPNQGLIQGCSQSLSYSQRGAGAKLVQGHNIGSFFVRVLGAAQKPKQQTSEEGNDIGPHEQESYKEGLRESRFIGPQTQNVGSLCFGGRTEPCILPSHASLVSGSWASGDSGGNDQGYKVTSYLDFQSTQRHGLYPKTKGLKAIVLGTLGRS